MPITSLEQNKRLPLIGKIRLGERNESGGIRKVTHFVLKDAPMVEEVYGADPDQLDIIFPHRDREIVLPTWFRFYAGGYKDSTGAMTGGELQCKGTGLGEGGAPGTAEHHAMRDPVTRQLPMRECLQEQCPDFYDAKGNQQCKAGMKVIAILPKVTLEGAFHIDTTSWNSMGNFISVFDWALSRPEYYQHFTNIPFTLYREEHKGKYFDAKSKTKRSSVHHIMKLRVNSKLLAEMQSKNQLSGKHQDLMLTAAESDLIDQMPMEDHYSLPTSQVTEDVESDAARLKIATQLATEDPDIVKLIKKLEQVTGKDLSNKQKVLSVRRYEKTAGVKTTQDLKTAVVNGLLKALSEIQPAANPPNSQPSVTPGASETGGII